MTDGDVYFGSGSTTQCLEYYERQFCFVWESNMHSEAGPIDGPSRRLPNAQLAKELEWLQGCVIHGFRFGMVRNQK